MPGRTYDRVILYQEKVDVVSTAAEAVRIDKFGFPPQMPIRRRAFQDPPPVFQTVISAAETLTIDKWFAEPAQPVRRLRRLPDYPYLSIDAKQLTLPETTTIDRYGYPTQDPIRRKAFQDNPIIFGQPIGAETITIDKWLAEISQPLNRSVRIAYDMIFVSVLEPPTVLGRRRRTRRIKGLPIPPPIVPESGLPEPDTLYAEVQQLFEREKMARLENRIALAERLLARRLALQEEMEEDEDITIILLM